MNEGPKTLLGAIWRRQEEHRGDDTFTRGEASSSTVPPPSAVSVPQPARTAVRGESGFVVSTARVEPEEVTKTRGESQETRSNETRIRGESTN
jgi:hypothetical protein